MPYLNALCALGDPVMLHWRIYNRQRNACKANWQYYRKDCEILQQAYSCDCSG